MNIINGIPVCGTYDEQTIGQATDLATRAERVALMADNHFGYIAPIGSVAAYRDKVSVAGVGFDIACGNAAIRTNLTVDGLTDINGLADEINETLSFGMGRKNVSDDAPVDHPLFESDAWNAVPDLEKLKEKARSQLGTVGGGNHYVDVFSDQFGYVWVGVHFGSRGFGHTVASGFLSLSQGEAWGKRVKEAEALLDLGSDLGQSYWALMNLCGEYAYAGREWVARKVVSLMGGEELELVHNHHNFAWKEIHGGEELVVVRKGATPAFPGQLGFVGGSMGDSSVILEGTESPETEALMNSTVHGAGRVMSRTQAAGKWDYKNRRRKEGGLISEKMMKDWIERTGVTLRGGGRDEAPQAYRRLDEVLEAQGSTIKILYTLSPLIVVMADDSTTDPYKD